jgi:oxygen-independent coproporphyrinogen-3 oxidase
VQTLMREIELVARRLSSRHRVSHIYFGGGSPSLLAPEDWRCLFDRLHGFFDVTEKAEIAVEIDPRKLPGETIAALAEMGVNRASFGVQDFNPEVQQAINRVQSFELTARAVDAFRSRGIQSLNIDLIYGLTIPPLNNPACCRAPIARGRRHNHSTGCF